MKKTGKPERIKTCLNTTNIPKSDIDKSNQENNSKFRFDTEERRKREQISYRLKELYKNAGFKLRHASMTLNSYEKPPAEILKYDGKCNLLLHGTVGTGKTHAAIGIAKKLIDTKMMKVKIITAVNLLYQIRKTFRMDSPGPTDELIEKYSKIQLLVIDDLGAEKSTEWVRETFYLIIDNRYSNMLPTIVTSNLNPKELAEKLDDRLMSRLLHGALVVKLEGKDRRL